VEPPVDLCWLRGGQLAVLRERSLDFIDPENEWSTTKHVVGVTASLAGIVGEASESSALILVAADWTPELGSNGHCVLRYDFRSGEARTLFTCAAGDRINRASLTPMAVLLHLVERNENRVVELALRDGTVRAIDWLGGPLFDAVAAPVGTTIAVRSLNGLEIVDLSTQSRLVITPLAELPSWSPFGQQLAFMRDDFELWLATGQELERVAWGDAPLIPRFKRRSTAPRWSPDGRLVCARISSMSLVDANFASSAEEWHARLGRERTALERSAKTALFDDFEGRELWATHIRVAVADLNARTVMLVDASGDQASVR
jgi:hypothetical protein